MIDPAKVPQFTGDLDQLSHHIGGLRRAAEGIRLGGSTAHSQFQTLSAVYSAPEAEDLFASTAPVRDGADSYANKVVTVAEALAEYASTVKPIAERLKALQAQAVDFLNDVRGDDGKIDDDWRKDEGKHSEYTTLYNDIIEAEAAFQAAEVAANNKITALVDGTQYVMETGGNMLRPIGAKTYGYTADVLKQMEKLPWGTPETRKREGLEWVSYQVTSFTEGFLVDGGWETVKGLATLAGFNGSDAQNQAWKGLGLLATGVAFSTMPGVSTKYWQTPANKLPPLMRDSRRAVTETGKALVAYDMWSKNPARAGGTVSFNVITTVFTGGAGAAAKGGTAARAAAIAGKAARLIDPVTYVIKGTKFSAVTIRDTFAHLKNSRGAVNLEMPAGTYRIPDQTTALPARPATLPERFQPLVAPSGKVVYLDTKTFALVDEHQNVIQRPEDIPKEAAAPGRLGEGAEALPRRGPVLVGVHAGDDATAALGRDGDVPPRSSPLQGPEAAAHTGDGVGGSAGRSGDDTASPGSGDPMPGDRVDHDSTPAGDQATTGHGGAGAGSEGSGAPRTGGSHVPGAVTVTEPPRGNLPDGSWEGENGLRLSPGDNATADDFMRQSAEAEPRITDTLQQITHNVDDGRLIGLDYRLKGEDSLKRKLATQLINQPERSAQSALGKVKDSIRYTVEFPSPHYAPGVQQAVDTLRAQGFESVTFKNTWDSPGYKGINSTWLDPATGRIFEVQFHTPESFVAKMDTHVLYEKGRLPGVTREELDAINAQQNEMFDQVPVPRETGTIDLTHDVRPGPSATAGASTTGSHHGVGEVRSNAPPGAGGAVPDEQAPHHDAGQSHTADSTDSHVNHDSDVAHSGTDASDGMGTRRDYEARVSPESTIAVPPKEASDLVLETGDHVYFGDGATAIGYDQNTVG
ncbi:hypothetical protein ACFWY6_30285, partial [Streptomyces sp. NPDC059037]|uniref:hypothetical protein n=1 Tax=Streptomyces sp. NPDC059037 TaxID=3346710 RepID=UPI0036BE59B9